MRWGVVCGGQSPPPAWQRRRRIQQNEMGTHDAHAHLLAWCLSRSGVVRSTLGASRHTEWARSEHQEGIVTARSAAMHAQGQIRGIRWSRPPDPVFVFCSVDLSVGEWYVEGKPPPPPRQRRRRIQQNDMGTHDAHAHLRSHGARLDRALSDRPSLRAHRDTPPILVEQEEDEIDYDDYTTCSEDEEDDNA